MSAVEIARRQPKPSDVRRILDALPDWFGIDSANDAYVEDSQTLPTYLAQSNGAVVGLLTVKRHYPESAEVHLLAVVPDRHRHGIGSALLGVAEFDLAAEGCRFLQVKTLGPSYPDEFYARTRDFYRHRGFVDLEEFEDFWPGNPALLMVKALNAASRSPDA